MTDVAVASRPSYRERQRAQLRDDIERAALRLFAAHGYDTVTTDAIATEVGISLSTFFRHVSSKEELLTGAVRRGRKQVVANFAARPLDEPVTEGLAQAILQRTEQFADEDELVELWREAMASAPALVRRASFVTGEDREQLVTLVAARLGTDSRSDLRPGVLVQVMLAAAEHAYELWLEHTTSVPLHELTAQVLSLARCVGDHAEPPTRARGLTRRKT